MIPTPMPGFHRATLEARFRQTLESEGLAQRSMSEAAESLVGVVEIWLNAQDPTSPYWRRLTGSEAREPKYTQQVRAILEEYYGQGQGFSPGALVQALRAMGVSSRSGGVPNPSSALAYLVEIGEVVKYSVTNYALAPDLRRSRMAHPLGPRPGDQYTPLP